MSLLSRSLPVFTSLAISLVAAPSHAGSSRTITSGLGCVQAYGQAEAKTSYGDDGGLYNDAPDWYRTAVCPLPHNTPLYFNSVATVDVLDLSYDLDASCRLVMRTPTWTTWGAAAVTNGSNGATQRLSLTHDAGSYVTANVHLLCYLPPVYQGNRSGLIGFDATVKSLF